MKVGKIGGGHVFFIYVLIVLFCDLLGRTILLHVLDSQFYINQLALVLQFVLVVAFFYAVLKYEGKQLRSYLNCVSLNAKTAVIFFGLGVLIAVANFGYLAIQVYLSSIFSLDYGNSLWTFEIQKTVLGPNEKLGNQLEMILLFLVTQTVLGPLSEELCFRGLILQKWSEKQKLLVAIVLSSVVFTVLHPVELYISVFAGSIFYSLVYIYTRNILFSFITHLSVNLIAWLFEGFGVLGCFTNKNPDDINSMFVWRYELTTGLLATIAIVVLLRYIKKTKGCNFLLDKKLEKEIGFEGTK